MSYGCPERIWAGPPFASSIWRWVTSERVKGTPVWLPRFGDGSIIRFTAQDNALAAFDYAAANYIDAWVAVTEPAGWNADAIEKLKGWSSQRESD